jgi:lipopolysaccharide/colanic/teichoic acid biosynthesis glycosyltransferase
MSGLKNLRKRVVVSSIIQKWHRSLEQNIQDSFCDIRLHEENGSFGKLAFWMLMTLRYGIKRMIDILFSFLLVTIALPLFVGIAAAIKWTSEGPVFFRQERVGHRGRLFRIFKFRTMIVEKPNDQHRKIIQGLINEEGAEKEDVLAGYLEYLDKRITKIGHFLRASSLDELPQLFNVLLGNMSLVGPRPHPVYEVEEYKAWYKRRLCVKPGLTGWSKLNLRLTPKNYEEAILYDLWYVDHWNIGLDLRILFLTVPFVLSMKDAR